MQLGQLDPIRKLVAAKALGLITGPFQAVRVQVFPFMSVTLYEVNVALTVPLFLRFKVTLVELANEYTSIRRWTFETLKLVKIVS